MQGRWLIEPKGLARTVQRLVQAQTLPAEAVATLTIQARELQGAPLMVGDVAVIPICGPIVYRKSWWSEYLGCAAIEELQAQFRFALADAAVRAIVFRVDSPGGVVDMVPEFADEVFAARGQKPIVAVADVEVCSAAYWIAAQADVIVATASSQLGSIGVYRMHQDLSGYLEEEGVKITLIAHGAHKVEGNPYEPLPADVQARWQAEVSEVGVEFETAVARGRGVTRKDVIDRFGQGLVFRGRKAISLGLADKLGTFAFAVGRAGRLRADDLTPALLSEVFGDDDAAPEPDAVPEPDLAQHGVIDLLDAHEG